jgi:hypothetical protein
LYYTVADSPTFFGIPAVAGVFTAVFRHKVPVFSAAFGPAGVLLLDPYMEFLLLPDSVMLLAWRHRYCQLPFCFWRPSYFFQTTIFLDLLVQPDHLFEFVCIFSSILLLFLRYYFSPSKPTTLRGASSYLDRKYSS